MAAFFVAVFAATEARAQWIPNYQNYTIQRIGLYGPQQGSTALFFNAPGFVAGTANSSGVFPFGQVAWAWNGATNTQIGLTGAGYSSGPGSPGSPGRQYSQPRLQNPAGQVAGFSQRFNATGGANGQDAWVYNPTANITTRVGLTGAGYSQSEPEFQNATGPVVGFTFRSTGLGAYNGRSEWVWDGNTTTLIGLTGTSYTGNAGYQLSVSRFQNEAGQVAGESQRIIGVDSDNGQNAWIYSPASGAITQIGLIGTEHTGSEGYQYTEVRLQNDAGQIAGASIRYTGVNTYHGENTWVYDPTTSTSVLTGLTGSAYTGATGVEFSINDFQNAAGQIVGASYRILGVDSDNGPNTWAYNPSTGVSVQTGLTGAAHTGSAGYQFSENTFQNDAGQVAGYSKRSSGVNTENGRDAWYYDPATGVTSPIIGSVRTSDNYAFSQATSLTEEGFLVGKYTYFAGGVGAGEDRAFVFRPDLGFTDLGNLVAGGLATNGWSTLLSPFASDALKTIVGYGLVNGQTSGQSVFAMVRTPAPLCVGDLNGDNAVNTADLTRFLGLFGTMTTPGGPGDFNNDGAVNTADLTRFLGRFGQACP